MSSRAAEILGERELPILVGVELREALVDLRIGERFDARHVAVAVAIEPGEFRGARAAARLAANRVARARRYWKQVTAAMSNARMVGLAPTMRATR